MRFWDTSAIVPLVTEESTTPAMSALLAEDPEIVVACFTTVEVTSAIWRQFRENGDDSLRKRAESLLEKLVSRWFQVDDVALVTSTARGVLTRHPLKAADALQLASAISLVNHPGELPYVTLDHQLAIAASKEGFPVISA